MTEGISKDKKQALNIAVSAIEKRFGRNSIMRLGDDNKVNMDIDTTPTGSLSLDLALGVGGIPKGRIIEIYGTESSGKTTLSLHMMAEVQKMGGVVAFIDAEHALDTGYAGNLGVNTDDLLVSQPDTGEQALEIVDTLVRSGAVDLLVVDSVAALVPKAEIEGSMGDSHMGLQARLMSQALRKLAGIISRSNCSVIFINQLRHKIGVFYGNPETTTGGNALKYYASIRMEIRKTDIIGKTRDQSLGIKARVKVVKNKLAAPFRMAEFEIIYGKGINRLSEIVDLAVNEGIIEKSGSWYSYNGDKLGQGKDVVKTFIEENNLEEEFYNRLVANKDTNKTNDKKTKTNSKKVETEQTATV